MNYGQVYYTDTANGVGCRTAFFVSGCYHHCPGCFNEATWDFNYGKPFTKDVEDEIVESLKPPYMDGLTILGGEPMERANQEAVCHLIQRVKKEAPHATIWMYSGFTWEELLDKDYLRCHSKYTSDILSNIDVLVDGRFELKLKDFRLRFRGSSNQRIIDVKKSLSSGKVVLTEYM